MTHVSLTFLVFAPFVLAGVVFLWAHLRMALHETAHYLAAWLVDFHPVQMEWGSGEKGWRFRLLGVSVVLHAQPWNGLTFYHLPSLDGLRWRGALYILAGTAVDVSLLLLLRWVNHHAEFTLGFPPLWYWFTSPLFVVQGFTILLTMVPMDLQIEELKSDTDGKQLLQFLAGSRARKIRNHRQEYLTEMQRYQPDLKLEDCWLYRPDPEQVRLRVRSVIALNEGRIKEGLADAEKLLSVATMAPGERAQILDHMAIHAGLVGKRHDLERALTWAREAYALLPGAPPVRCTLGALLVESGGNQLSEAVSFLNPLTASENEPEIRARASCYLAKVCDQLHDGAEALRWLGKARAIKPDHPLITLVEAELGMSTVEG